MIESLESFEEITFVTESGDNVTVSIDEWDGMLTIMVNERRFRVCFDTGELVREQ